MIILALAAVISSKINSRHSILSKKNTYKAGPPGNLREMNIFEIEKFLKNSNESEIWIQTTLIYINDDLTVNPKENLTILRIGSYAGNMKIQRGKMAVIPDESDMTLKFRTPPESERVDYKNNIGILPPVILVRNHRVRSIEFDYYGIKGHTEAAAFYLDDSSILPKILVNCGNYKCALKKRNNINIDYILPNKIDSTFNNANIRYYYFEVGPKASEEIELKIKSASRNETKKLNEAANYISICEDNDLILDGDTFESNSTSNVNISLSPNEKLRKLELKSLSGNVTIDRNNFIISLNQNKDLNLKIKTRGRAGNASLPPVSLVHDNHGIRRVEFEYRDLNENDEVDAFLYFNNQSLPEVKASCVDIDCMHNLKMKSKEVSKADYLPLVSSSRMLKEGEKLMLAYFVVTSQKSIEIPNSNEPLHEEKKSLSVGSIAGIVISCIIAVAAIMLAVVLFVRSKTKNRVGNV